MYKLERDYKVELANLEFQSSLLLSQMAVLKDDLESTYKNVSTLDAELEALNKSNLPKKIKTLI